MQRKPKISGRKEDRKDENRRQQSGIKKGGENMEMCDVCVCVCVGDKSTHQTLAAASTSASSQCFITQYNKRC